MQVIEAVAVSLPEKHQFFSAPPEKRAGERNESARSQIMYYLLITWEEVLVRDKMQKDVGRKTF